MGHAKEIKCLADAVNYQISVAARERRGVDCELLSQLNLDN